MTIAGYSRECVCFTVCSINAFPIPCFWNSGATASGPKVRTLRIPPLFCLMTALQ